METTTSLVHNLHRKAILGSWNHQVLIVVCWNPALFMRRHSRSPLEGCTPVYWNRPLSVETTHHHLKSVPQCTGILHCPSKQHITTRRVYPSVLESSTVRRNNTSPLEGCAFPEEADAGLAILVLVDPQLLAAVQTGQDGRPLPADHARLHVLQQQQGYQCLSIMTRRQRRTMMIMMMMIVMKANDNDDGWWQSIRIQHTTLTCHSYNNNDDNHT